MRPRHQTWGIALEETFWPHSRSVSRVSHQMASLSGTEHVSPWRNVQIQPYGIFTGARFLDADAAGGAVMRGENDARVGVDGKWVLRDSLVLDVAVNPDFSRVESDEPQVTVNQRFEVFVPERRPFFVENAGLLRTPIDLFFSRRVTDPSVGARMTAHWALGHSEVSPIDDRASETSRENAGEPGARAGIAVARVQREIADQSMVGMLVTSGTFGARTNPVMAVDGRLKLSSNWVVNAPLARTQVAEGAGSQTGR